MISEGSCDTKDWNNDAENLALHHRSKLHFKIYYNKKQKKYKVTLKYKGNVGFGQYIFYILKKKNLTDIHACICINNFGNLRISHFLTFL